MHLYHRRAYMQRRPQQPFSPPVFNASVFLASVSPWWAKMPPTLFGARAESLVRDNPFLEFRLDYLAQPAVALPKLKHFLDLHPEATVIATCRRAVNGGKFKGSAAAQLDILTKAAALGFQLVDIELESSSILKPAELGAVKATGWE